MPRSATTPRRVPQPPRGSRRGSPLLRLRFGFVVIAMVLSVYGVRLLQLQGLDPWAYAEMAAAEGMVQVELPARRGGILDRNGEPLATSVDGRMVVVDPQQLTDEQVPDLAREVAGRLGADYFTVLRRLGRDDTRFQYLARRVPSTLALDVVADLAADGYKGLDTRIDPVREYPAGDVAANLVGFLGSDRPLAGLEVAFDRHLSGRDGKETFEVGGGNRIPLGETTITEPVDGRDLRLTIERDLQWFVQKVLRQTVEDYRAESGAIVVLETRTGEVLSLADYPSYDASDPLLARKGDLGARSLSGAFEPGSVQKVLTMAGLLDAGKVTPRTRISVPAKLERDGRTINDWFDHGRIRLTLAGVLAKSSNIGTVLAAERLGFRALHGYLEDFGLGRRTGIGVLGESAGVLPDASLWTGMLRDRIAFGQSFSVNALQMAAAVNAIANDGVRVPPSLVKGTATNDEDEEVGTDTVRAERVVSARSARMVARMMERVLDPEDGVAAGAAVPGYRVAGKTGTAQMVRNGVYSPTDFVVSFAGFAPADDPRFTVYVVISDPGVDGGGGSIAGPAFSAVMGHLLHRYQVPPTETRPSRIPVEW